MPEAACHAEALAKGGSQKYIYLSSLNNNYKIELKVIPMRDGLTIILSIFTGILISLPGAFSFNPLFGLPFIVLFGAVGGLIGYKRRQCDAFFYFTLICSIALLSMLIYASMNAQQMDINSLPTEIVTDTK